jgi:aspartyl-tRNA(Asn)/glutamyl-tRNA(Gln) amidotransferase subunit B
MITEEIRSQYKVTVGIECHVQFKTKTKLFAAVGNDAREAPPNTLVSHICFGLPGALPVLNKEAVHLAVRAAFALGTKPQKFSKFDRKHYFYPDLPMGYQITQYDEPIVLGGKVDIEVDGKTKTIGITRAHMEADAGKSTHPAGADYSLVDLNRAGTPLLEIVSEPDMHSPAEAKAYARELYLLMRYADVSDANLYYGNMRFDVNVSVSKTDQLGTRTETKNLNSFRSVERAVEYETERQIEVLEKGGKVAQETRGWDDAKQKTISQRSKENAEDYRYMPDPDLPPITLEDDYIQAVEKEMPRLPEEWRQLLKTSGVEGEQAETLLDAQLDFESDLLAVVASCFKDPERGKTYANWIINIEIPLRRQKTEEDGSGLKIEDWVRADIFDWVYRRLQDKAMNSNQAAGLLADILSTNDIPADLNAYAEEKGYIQVSDEGEIKQIVEKVLDDNAQAAEDVKNGEVKAIGFLVGQVMKESKGKANPQLAQKLIRQLLGL